MIKFYGTYARINALEKRAFKSGKPNFRLL